MTQVSNSDYLKLLNDEGVLVQVIEILKSSSEVDEVNYLSRIKKLITIKRIELKESMNMEWKISIIENNTC